MCIADEVPFEIPETWEWARVSSLGSIVRGSGIKRTETVESGKPCVRYGELYTTYHTSFTQAVSFVSEELFDRCKHFSFGDILMTLTGENKPDIAKAVAYLGNDEIAAGGDLAYWTAHGMNPLYLTYLMASPYVVGRKVNLATGDIIVHISGDKLGTILIPIPPLSEQQRIVDKILEAEVKLVEYTDKENSLDVLQKNFPDALKKSILQWAVQGKLVPQDPTDEPASVLLERIRAEKEQLIKTGKIKRDKHESVIFRRDNSHYEKLDGIERCIDDEIPFDLPVSWEWVRLGSLLKIESGKPLTSKEMKPGTIPVYGGNGITGYHNDYLVDEETVVIGRVGYYCGSVHVTDPKAWVTDNAFITTYPMGCIDRDYLVFTLRSMNLGQNNKSTAQPVVSGKKIYPMLFPLPPLAEQKRIAWKLKEILPFCKTI